MEKTTEFMKDVERVAKTFNDRVVDGQSLVIIATDELNGTQRQTIIAVRGRGEYLAKGLSDFIGDNKELVALAMLINQIETKKNNHDNE